MNHGSQRIQQERRIFSIREEAGGKQGEYGQGERGKAPEGTSWKLAFACENCGTVKPGRYGGANRFCQNSCQHEWVVKKWYACSVCHAAIGLGGKTSSKLLRVNSANITRQWKANGIVSDRPKNGSWFINSRTIITGQAREESKPWIEYERAWMREIREEERSFTDWGVIWDKEQDRKKSLHRYHSLSIDQKKKWNRLASSRNPERRARVLIEWKRNKMATDPIYRMINGFRSRLCALIKGKDTKTKDLIGCSPLQLRQHIESGFKRGMTWANYGSSWHVDHILPCSSFDHKDPKQVKQCWHWTNLRALDAKANMEKSDSITEPQMSLLLCSSR